MVWNIDLDDFQQSCSLSTRPYPLMSLMSEILNSPAGEPTYNTSSGSTENKPSGSLSLESEEEWSSSNGAANSDNDQGNIGSLRKNITVKCCGCTVRFHNFGDASRVN